jgi:hypothetical protein
MAMKALLEGSAGIYRIRGAIWELGSFAYRAVVHLVPTGPRPKQAGPVVSADGMTLKEVLRATKEQVETAIDTSVEELDVLDGTASTAGRDAETPPLRRPMSPRYPSPTD